MASLRMCTNLGCQLVKTVVHLLNTVWEKVTKPQDFKDRSTIHLAHVAAKLRCQDSQLLDYIYILFRYTYIDFHCYNKKQSANEQELLESSVSLVIAQFFIFFYSKANSRKIHRPAHSSARSSGSCCTNLPVWTCLCISFFHFTMAPCQAEYQNT